MFIEHCVIPALSVSQALKNDYYPFDPSHQEMLATSQESIIHPLHHCYDYIATEDLVHCHFEPDLSHMSTAAMCHAQLDSNNTVSTVDSDFTLDSGMTVELQGEGSGNAVTIVMISRDQAMLIREDGAVTDSPGQAKSQQTVCPELHIASTQHNIESSRACNDYRGLPSPSSPDSNTDIQTAYVSNPNPLKGLCPHPVGSTDSNMDERKETGDTCIQDDCSSMPQGNHQFVSDSGVSTEYIHTETPL